MPTKRIQLVNGEIYHVVSRAVGDTVIFKDENDFYRGIFSIYEFNNSNPVNIWLRRQQRLKEKSIAGSDPAILSQVIPERDLFVEVLAFCLMPNHIHLLLKQLKGGSISQFMQKVGTGYAVYFNKRYNRKGHLFNRFKAIDIKTNEQLQNVFAYIHTNPISLIEPGFKKNGIKNIKNVNRFLKEDYRWSSFFDFIGKKNFPSITKRNFLLEAMGGEDGCEEVVKNWIIYKKELKNISSVVLE